jgi:hypothetical protein
MFDINDCKSIHMMESMKRSIALNSDDPEVRKEYLTEQYYRAIVRSETGDVEESTLARKFAGKIQLELYGNYLNSKSIGRYR